MLPTKTCTTLFLLLLGGLATAGNPAKPNILFILTEDQGPHLGHDGMQERSVYDGRWKLLYREKAETGWRQVNADLKDAKPWGNRSHAKTVRIRHTLQVLRDAYLSGDTQTSQRKPPT